MHVKSQFHIKAGKSFECAKDNSLPNVIDCYHQTEYIGTSKLFSSLPFLARKDRPFFDYFDLLQVQDLNGAGSPTPKRFAYSLFRDFCCQSCCSSNETKDLSVDSMKTPKFLI